MDLCKIGHANLAEKKINRKILQNTLSRMVLNTVVNSHTCKNWIKGYGNLKESVTAGESLQANSSA